MTLWTSRCTSRRRQGCLVEFELIIRWRSLENGCGASRLSSTRSRGVGWGDFGFWMTFPRMKSFRGGMGDKGLFIVSSQTFSVSLARLLWSSVFVFLNGVLLLITMAVCDAIYLV